MTAGESTVDTRLLPLLAAPWTRPLYIARVSSIVDRYRALLELARDREPPVEKKGQRSLELLYRHPSALLERMAVSADELASRLDAAEAELRSLRAAAPLPPPVDRADRRWILAIADVEWWMRELRFLRRGSRKLPPALLLERYRGDRRLDPIQEADENVLRGIAAIRRGRLFRVCCQLAGLRHRVPDLRARIAPEQKKLSGPEGRFYVCPASQIREGSSRTVSAFGRTIAVFRDQGALKAIDDECPHRGGPLNLGEIEDGAVICPLHGWCFDLTTGRMRGSPRVGVPVFEVIVEGDAVYVGGMKRGDE